MRRAAAEGDDAITLAVSGHGQVQGSFNHCRRACIRTRSTRQAAGHALKRIPVRNSSHTTINIRPLGQVNAFFGYLYERAPVCKVTSTSGFNRIGCRLISGLAVQATPAGPDGFRREWPYLFVVLAGTSNQLGLHSRGPTCFAITLILPSQPVDGFLPC